MSKKMNRFASLRRQGQPLAPQNTDEPKRRPLDDYETPDEVTELLTRCVRFSPASIYDPACGSGRLVRFLEKAGYATCGTDIKNGEKYDYLKERFFWQGAIVTNPPFKHADEFVNAALDSAAGGVAMLLNAGFMHGQTRHDTMWRYTPPRYVIPVPFRIQFHIGDTGERTKSQVFSHCWFVWETRNKRLLRSTEVLTLDSTELPRVVS